MTDRTVRNPPECSCSGEVEDSGFRSVEDEAKSRNPDQRMNSHRRGLIVDWQGLEMCIVHFFMRPCPQHRHLIVEAGMVLLPQTTAKCGSEVFSIIDTLWPTCPDDRENENTSNLSAVAVFWFD